MKKRVFNCLFIFALVFAIGLIGISSVKALSGTFVDRKSSTNYQVKISGKNYAGFCMKNGVDHPPKNSSVTCTKYQEKGPVLWVMNQKHTYTTQNAVWELVSSGSKTSAGKTLAKTAKSKHSNYTTVPSISIGSIGAITAVSGNYYYKNVNVSTTNVSGGKYTVALSGAPSGTGVYTTGGAKITGATTAKTIQIRVPISSATVTTKSFTVKVTVSNTCHNVAYKCTSKKYGTKRQPIGIIYSECGQTSKTTKSVTASVINKACTKIGSVYTNKAGQVVTEAQYYDQCFPKCAIKDGKYYDKNGKVVTEAEYNKQCNPKCAIENGKYYDDTGKAVTEAEYNKACNPKCEYKDGKYYNKEGKPVSETEFYKACNPSCVVDGDKYYNKDGKPVTEDEYNRSCNPQCEYKDGKYYDADHKVVSEADFYISCNPKCELKDGKYYNRVGKPVSESEYYNDCNPKCAKENGKYYDKSGKPVTLAEYYKSCFPLTPNPDPTKAVDTQLVRYEQNYHYTIKHEVPHRTSSDYYKSYVFTDVLEDPLQVKSEDDVKIIQLDKATGKETDWTNKFVIKIEGQKVTASLKDSSDKDFYGTRDANDKEYNKEYSYILTASLKDKAETKYDMKKYKQGESYIIPDIANISVVDQNGRTESKDTNKVEVIYSTLPAPTKMVEKIDQTASYEQGTKYVYNITQYVPKYTGNQKYKSFEFVDEFEKPINIDSPKALVIRNASLVDVTNWFDVKVKDQKLTAKLKDEYNNDAFYGQSYEFFVTVNLKQGYNLKKYLKGNQYVIPNYAKIITDGNQEAKTNIVDVTVALKAVPKTILPNTASPLQVAGVAAGIAILISGVAAILNKYKLLPIKK